MRTFIVGTSGQLACELNRSAHADAIEALPSQKLDLTDERTVRDALDRMRPDLVLNAGAYTAVDRAETDSERAFAVNQRGPATLASWCDQHGAALVHVSTDYVFDGAKASPYLPDDPPCPINVYGASKLAGEVAIRSSLARHVIVRTSWVFSATGQNFVKTMLRLARERDELRVVADQFGRPTPAAELARALWALAAHVANGTTAWGTHHFAGEGSTNWHEFAQAVVDGQRHVTGKQPKVVPITTSEFPTPARRPASSVLDTSSFERAFGVTPAPWHDGLQHVLDELLARP